MFQKDQMHGDRYELVRPLGDGGMAFVWLANDTQLPRQVAIKFGKAMSEKEAKVQLNVLSAEATNGARLVGHSHIVTVLDAGMSEVSGQLTPFVVMEPVDPLDVETHLSDNIAPFVFPETKRLIALDIVRQFCEAIAHTHSHGILHRDIKPKNALMASGVVKVADFGLSRVVGAPTRAGTVMDYGTPPYFAPEQQRKKRATKATDIYQLAATAHHIITGQLPFDYQNHADLRAAIDLESPPNICEVAPDYPFVRIADCVQSMLAKSPADRPPIRELHELLCIEVFRPWTISLHGILDSRIGVVAKISGFEEDQVRSDYTHAYIDPREAFRHLNMFGMHGLRNAQIVPVETRVA